MVSHESQIATLDAHTQKPRHRNTTKKFVVAALLQKLQFILQIQYITVGRHKETLYS